jgi:hypothetical protein
MTTTSEFDFSHLNDEEFLGLFLYAAYGVDFVHTYLKHPDLNKIKERMLASCHKGRGVPSYENFMVPMLFELATRIKAQATRNTDILEKNGKLFKNCVMDASTIARIARTIEISSLSVPQVINPMNDLF